MELLAPFEDSTKYAALAIVHGLGRRAPAAFDTAKQRLSRGRGLIWLPDPELVGLLEGPAARVRLWRKLLKPASRKLVRFASVGSKRITSSLPWYRVTALRVDQGFLEAGDN